MLTRFDLTNALQTPHVYALCSYLPTHQPPLPTTLPKGQ